MTGVTEEQEYPQRSADSRSLRNIPFSALWYVDNPISIQLPEYFPIRQSVRHHVSVE